MSAGIIDRDDILDRLLSALTQSNLKANYALIGPRRIGKTKILEELEQRLRRRTIITARIDFSKYSYNPKEFSQALVDSLTESYQRTLDPTSRLLAQVKKVVAELKNMRRMRIEFDLAFDETGKPVYSVRPTLAKEEPKYAELFEKGFSYASHLADVSGKKVVIMLDEAQKIVGWTALNGMKTVMDQFRSIIDELGNVSIVLGGSRVHMLESIFGEAGSPLFGRFTLIEVGPLQERDAITLYLRSALGSDRNEVDEAYQLVGGHPFYLLVMAEARRPQEAVSDRYHRLLTDVTGGLYLYVNYVLHEDLGSRVTETYYARILSALAQEEMKISEIADRIGTQASWLTRYLTRLIEFELVEKTNGTYRLQDRIVRDYFRFNYPEEPAPSEEGRAD
jgi:hypothetical protein